jgi:aspartyl-tRNA(Asn)/glutamyl-tRNA(Gln) amidotransferase subunit B
VLAEMAGTGVLDPGVITARLGFEAMDTSELEAMVDAAIAAQPDAWQKYCSGEQKALGAIVGHIMKASKGQADGKLVNQLLNSRKG